MTADTTVLASTPGGQPGAAPAKTRKLTTPLVLVLIAAGLIVLSLVRVFTGADDLTSAGAVGAALAAAVPIGLAGLGGLWSERAGVVNIGLEGMMILGTWGGAWGALEFGIWAGILTGALAGALGGLLHAVATVTFNVDHIVSGVAITNLQRSCPSERHSVSSTDTGASVMRPKKSVRIPLVK